MIKSVLYSILCGAVTWSTGGAYSFVSTPRTIQKATYLSMKRGRGSLGKELTGGKKSPMDMDGDSGVSRWCALPRGTKLPKAENEVQFIDTNLPTLVDKSVNPTGAVSVLKYKDNTYCFSASCPSCKIPLKKAKAFDPEPGQKGPRLVCDFCKSTYSLSNGARLKSEKPGGIFGGLVQTVLSANADNSSPLPLYQLGELDGKLVIDPTVAK